MDVQPVLRLESVIKKFGDTVACDNVSIRFKPGKIVGLLGENGAGKTTVVSLLTGQLQPDSGKISVGKKSYSALTTERAVKEGIGAVHQNFRLVPTMTVLENFLLIPLPGFFFTRKRLISRIEKILARYKISISLGARVSSLTMGQKQQVEIVKLLLKEANVLLLDEPTSLLSEQESVQLFSTLEHLRDEGKSIVLITHKLKQALEVCDEIAVMNHGRITHHVESETIDGVSQLAGWIVNRVFMPDEEKEIIKPGQIVLKVDSLKGPGIKNISFTLRQGEIFSLVGLPGNGQRELINCITDARPVDGGAVTLFGKDVKAFYKDCEMSRFVSHIPEDRFEYRDNDELTVLDTFLLTTRDDFTESIWLDKEKAVGVVERLLNEFKVSYSSVHQSVSQLSGGNLQKLLFARAFYAKPRLLIVEQPGQGLDVEAAAEIHSLLIKAREAAAILIVTSDVSEAVALSDTIGVIHGGRLVLVADGADSEALNKIPQMMVEMFE